MEMNNFKFSKSNIKDMIITVDNYILKQNEIGKKVYILDSDACIYMIPLDKYNKNYDMFLIGNLGSKGEEGQIENLNKERDTIVLIKNDKLTRNWQTPKEVIKYVQENWNKTGEILIFDIYERD